MGCNRLRCFRMMIHEPVNSALMYYVFPSPSFCVVEHLYFETLPYGEKLKINLILNSSLVHLFYIQEKDPTPHLLLDKGEFTNVADFFLAPPMIWLRIIYIKIYIIMLLYVNI